MRHFKLATIDLIKQAYKLSQLHGWLHVAAAASTFNWLVSMPAVLVTQSLIITYLIETATQQLQDDM